MTVILLWFQGGFRSWEKLGMVVINPLIAWLCLASFYLKNKIHIQQRLRYDWSVSLSCDWCWTWNSNTLATWCEELTHLKRPWCWERLRAGGEGDSIGWDGWVASPTQWTWVWVDSGSWWWTGRPGMLQFMGLQRVGHNWATELNCDWILLAHWVPGLWIPTSRYSRRPAKDYPVFYTDG